MAMCSSILAWKISWTEEPGGLQFMGSQRVRHDWATEQRHTCILCIIVHCSVGRSRLTLWNPMECSMPGFLVLHHLPEFAQTHVYWVGDAIQAFHPLSSLSPPAFNLSQHQGFFPMSWLFALGGQSIGASVSASVLPMDIQGCNILNQSNFLLFLLFCGRNG